MPKCKIKNRKSQTAVEFVVLTGVMIVVFLVVYILVQQKILSASESRNDATAQQVMDILINEIKVAESVSDHYTRHFTMPSYLNNLNYSINIMPGVADTSEIVIKYYNKEKVYFLDSYVDPGSTVHVGLNTIAKNNSVIIVNPP